MYSTFRQPEFNCRFCDSALEHLVVDLGLSPLCEDFIQVSELNHGEVFYPLQVYVCAECWLVQAKEFTSNTQIFDDDYGYFSSCSTSWLAHARRYVDSIVDRLELSPSSHVVEIASNDGYLLRNFVERDIPCLGIDPAANVARAAELVGVPTRVEFFTEELAKSLVADGKAADLVIGNNVLAHTPYVRDFISGVAQLLKSTGTATFEFPHVQNLLQLGQFDTMYHEHYSYFSLYTVSRMFDHVNMVVVDVERVNTAGGSLRVYVQHKTMGTQASQEVLNILAEETKSGLQDINTYIEFGEKAATIKNELLKLLISLKEQNKLVVGYGAPGKGNTLLNYCGIKTDLLPFTCDMSKHKHGRLCPGSHIPIFPPEKIDEVRPDYILILPWNLEEEITTQLAHVREWGAKFIVPIPMARILD